MSERLNPAVIVFTGVILCGLCWIGGKHSADRWWQAQVAQQANQATTCYPVEDGRTTNWCTTGAPAGIGKPQAQQGTYIDRFIAGSLQAVETVEREEEKRAHPLKLGKPKSNFQMRKDGCKAFGAKWDDAGEGSCTFTQWGVAAEKLFGCPETGCALYGKVPETSSFREDTEGKMLAPEHDCQDTKPHGDYSGSIDLTTCFDRETNKVRYQQRILTAPIVPQ